MHNYIEVNLNGFSRNIQRVKNIVGSQVKIMVVLKADAYGHGALRLAKRAEDSGVSAIAIGTPEEGIFLRKNGINIPIIALDSITEGYEEILIKLRISPVISSYKALNSFEKAGFKLGTKANIHIKVDTGMGRLGINSKDLLTFLENAVEKKFIFIEGLMTHFATSFEKNNNFTEYQTGIFKTLVEKIISKGWSIPYIHAANSGAILNFPNSYFNTVRPGIILYGHLPYLSPVDPNTFSNKEDNFEPIMEFKSKIVNIGKVKKGESISYGRNFIAKNDITTATIPVGYASGFPRALSGKAKAIVRGKKVSQVGLICMNLSVLDVTEVLGVKVGDQIVLIGRQKNQQITVEDIASKVNTISYELLCRIGKNAERVYIGS